VKGKNEKKLKRVNNSVLQCLKHSYGTTTARRNRECHKCEGHGSLAIMWSV